MSENIKAPETPETPELSEELISINGRHFHKNTLNEEQQAAFQQAIEITSKIERKREEERDLTYARQYLVNFIEEGIEDYTEFIPEEAEQAEEAEEAEKASE